MHFVPNSKGDTVKSNSVSHYFCLPEAITYPYKDRLITYEHASEGICFKNKQTRVDYFDHYSIPFWISNKYIIFIGYF